MRDKDAIENERKNLARTIEKQGKAVDRLTDVEKHYRNQMVSIRLSENALGQISSITSVCPREGECCLEEMCRCLKRESLSSRERKSRAVGAL